VPCASWLFAAYRLLLITAALLLLPGCIRRSPRGVAQRYVENLLQFNYVECYSLLSTQDRADRSFHEFLTEIPLAPDVSPIWFRPILHDSHYELGDAYRNADGMTAYVPVRVTTLDLPLWERGLNAKAGRDGSASELAHRSLNTGVYPIVSYDDKIFLVKDPHHWRVLAGFAARDRVRDRHRQAMIDFYEGRLDQVISQYGLMITQLEHSPGTGNLGLVARFKTELAEVSKIKAEMPAAVAYGAKLQLNDVAMRMAEERVPAIFGEVTNSGNRPIDELRLAVTWYEGRGKDLKVVDREEHQIVLTPVEFTDFSRDVIPFVSGETRSFGFILSASPDVQQNATPYVTVASLAFTQGPAPLPRLEGTSNSTVPHPSDAPVRADAVSSPSGLGVEPSRTTPLIGVRPAPEGRTSPSDP
jgi:hypothetical protein